MQNTPNYNYNLPEYSDSADIAVLNANFSSIDANEYRIEGKLNALGNDIALPYDNTATYNVGDYVIYNNALYRCTTAIATAEDFDSTKWTAITIGGELKSHDTRISTLDGIRQDNAGFHNSIYRGKFLGTSITTEQYAQISAGTFDDMFIGDYWTLPITINGVTRNMDFIIASFDYWWNVGSTFPQGSNKHHVVMVPRGNLYTAQMNSTTINTGGYLGSKMYTNNLTEARNAIETMVTSAHLYAVKRYFSNSVDSVTGKASSQAEAVAKVELMNENMIVGSNCSGSLYDVNNDTTILPLFNLNPDSRNIYQRYWLRNCESVGRFSNCFNYGLISSANPVDIRGVRPCFAIYGGD